jgi:hypothetical protein
MNPILNAILSKGFIKAGRGTKSLIKGAKEHPIAAGIGVGALASAGTGIAKGENWLNKNRNTLDEQFSTMEEVVNFNDPWGDNIGVPVSKDGTYIRGEEADKYNPYSHSNGIENALYKFHTGQSPDLQKVSNEDLEYLHNWYSGAKESLESGFTETKLPNGKVHKSRVNYGQDDQAEIAIAYDSINKAIESKIQAQQEEMREGSVRY